MKKSKLRLVAVTIVLMLGLSTVALADTIRLRDGSVVRGQIIGYRDQQFTVLIGAGTRGRRSRMTIYMEDVESIEFDASSNAAAANTEGVDNTMPGDERSDNRTSTPPVAAQNPPANTRPQPQPRTGGDRAANTGTNSSPVYFPIRLRVRADNTSNGWNNSGLMVRAGQRLRITATGRVSLGGGNFSTPTGLPRLNDRDKLMRNDPTGALIAVIGDDNDEFIFIGANREFVAQRDGTLFLGVNEGNLGDNSGTYDVTVEAEAVSGSSRP